MTAEIMVKKHNRHNDKNIDSFLLDTVLKKMVNKLNLAFTYLFFLSLYPFFSFGRQISDTQAKRKWVAESNGD